MHSLVRRTVPVGSFKSSERLKIASKIHHAKRETIPEFFHLAKKQTSVFYPEKSHV